MIGEHFHKPGEECWSACTAPHLNEEERAAAQADADAPPSPDPRYYTYYEIKEHLAFLDLYALELQRQRDQWRGRCQHLEIEQGDEHYYCVSCKDYIGDVPEIHGAYYEGEQVWEDLDGTKSQPMTYEQATGSRIIRPDDPRIVR